MAKQHDLVVEAEALAKAIRAGELSEDDEDVEVAGLIGRLLRAAEAGDITDEQLSKLAERTGWGISFHQGP